MPEGSPAVAEALRRVVARRQRRRPTKPTGVFAAPIGREPFAGPHPQAVRQAERRTQHAGRQVARVAPQPAPSVPRIAPRNQPPHYVAAVKKLAGPLVRQIHGEATAQAGAGHGVRAQEFNARYWASVRSQLDQMGPQAKRAWRLYNDVVVKPAAQRRAVAQARELMRASGGNRADAMRLASRTIGPTLHEHHSLLSSVSPLSLAGLPGRFFAGPVATAVEQAGGSNLAGTLRLAREPEEIARTYAEHPGTIKRDLAYGRDFLLGTAAIPYHLVTDPTGTPRRFSDMAKRLPKDLIADEVARHKAAFEGNYGAFRKTVQQTGAIPYGLDYTALASGVGKAAGLLAREGALGARLEEFASRPRAGLRITPGEVRRQRDETGKIAPNLFRLYAQKKRDARRAASFERRDLGARAKAAEYNAAGEPAPGTRRLTQPRGYAGEPSAGKPQMSVRELANRRKAVERAVDRAGGKIHMDDRGRIESVRFTAERAASAHPAHFDRVARGLEALGFERRRVGGNLVFYAPREVAHRSRFLEARAARSIPAALKGKAVNEIRDVTAGVAHDFAKATGADARLLRVKGLSKHERAALYLAGTGRLPADNPAAAVERLNAIEARIRAERGPSKPLSRFQTDTLKRIAYLRQHAEQAFTPRLRQTIDTIRAQVKAGERENPFHVPGQLLSATYGPGALEVGAAERARIPVEAFDPRASAKAIARHAERQAGRDRSGFVADDLSARDAALRDEQTQLLHQHNDLVSAQNDARREIEAAKAAGDAQRAERLRVSRSLPLSRQYEHVFSRLNAIKAERDAIDARRGKTVTGRPEGDVEKIDWYHGTPNRFAGPPTAEAGQWSDLGVYLTSDPGYAREGYAKGPEGRVLKVRVAPERVFETRFGRASAEAVIAVGDQLMERLRTAVAGDIERRTASKRDRLMREAADIGWGFDRRDPKAKAVLRQIAEQARQEATAWAGNYLTTRQARNIEHWLEALRTNPELRKALETGEGRDTKVADLEGNPTTYLDAWRQFDIDLRNVSSDVSYLDGTGLFTIGHGPLREILQGLGYDAVRKVDISADALVVLNERLLGRRARTETGQQWLLNGAKRDRGETTAEWVKRVKSEMAKAGIDHPPFFAPSEELRTPKFSSYTAGGRLSPSPSARRTYALQRKGLERSDPQVIYEGIQRNHRTRISAQLIVDVFNRVAHHRYQDISTHELKRIAMKEGYDPTLYAIWYPKLYRDTLRDRLVGDMERTRAGQGRSTFELEARATAAGGEMGHLRELLDPAARDATVIVADHPRDVMAMLDHPRFQAEKGTLIPRAAYDELFSSTKETAAGRLMERLKTMQSRAVLGGLNVNWVQADAVVNALVATVFGGVSPADWIRERHFFRHELPPDVQKFVHRELDIGQSRSQVHVPHLGAAVNNRFVNYFRFLRESPWGRRLRPVQHTINGFLKAERAIGNNPQRRALAYHLVRKEAFRQFDENVGALNGMLHRVASIFTGGWHTPADVRDHMLAIVANKAHFEEIGRGVAEILGDWTTFTALERKTLGRYFFFYPYLRYSLKLAFYTLPLNHPVRLALVANLANLNMDEQRRLVGATGDDAYLMAGRYFYRDAKGQMHEYNVRTFNPIGNVVTESATSADLLQLLPPAFSIALGQVEKRDIYRGRNWRVKGSADQSAANDIGPLDGLLGSERWRILVRQAIELPPVTRELTRYMLPGEQGDDSLPFSPRPIHFKSAAREAQAQAKLKRDQMPFLQRILQDQFRAFAPKPSDITDVLQRRHAHKPGGTGPKPKGSGWGGASSKGSGWGGKAAVGSGWGG